MASTESKIRLIFDGVERGVVAAAAKARAAVKGLADENDRVSKSFDTLDKGASKVGAALAGIAKGILVLGAANAAIHVVSGLVGALTQLAPIALLLPGVLLAGAAAMGTFKIATAGFGDAISAGLSGDMAKFAEATKNMAPPMRDAAKAVVAFKPQIDDLKRTVQGNFWRGFSEPITKLGNSLLPTLKTGLGLISTELGNMTRNTIRVASTPLFQGQLASILVNTRIMLANMRPALGDVLAGFVSLGEVGSRFLPRLGTAIFEITAKFRGWVEANDEAGGKIERFIEGAIQGFIDLGAILVNVIGIANKIFTELGASMESPLAMLRDLTEQLNAFLETAAAQEGLRALGEILQEAGTAIKEVFLAAVKQVLPIIKAWAPAIKEIIVAFKNFALDLINTVGPALQSVGRFLSEHKEIVGPLAELILGLVVAFKGLKVLKDIATWASGAKTALKLLADVLPGLGTSAGKAGDGLGKTGKGLGAIPAPLKVLGIAAALAALAKAADEMNIAAAGGADKLTGYADDLHELVSAGERLLSGDFSVIPEQLNDINTEAQNFVDTWQAGKAPIQEFADTVNVFLNPSLSLLKGTLDNTRPAIAGFVAGVQGMPKTVGDSLVNLGNIIVGFGTQVTSTFNEKIKAGFDQTRTIVAGVPAAIVNALSPLGGLLANQGATSSASFATNIAAGFEKARQITAALPGQIVQAINPLAGALGNQGATAGNKFGTELGTAYSRARQITSALPGQIVQALSPLGGQMGNTGATAGSTFNNRLTGELNRAAGLARSATAGVAGAVAGALSGLGQIGVNAGVAVGQGLVRGLNAQRGAVAGAAAGLGATVAANKGPIEKDRRMLIPAGIALVQGLIAGMSSQVGSLAGFSSSLGPQIAGSIAGAGVSISAPNPSAGMLQQLLSSQGQAAPQVRVFIGDRELTDLVRTEITSSNRLTRRTVTAGAGTTF